MNKTANMQPIIIAYVPVLHQGYLNFLNYNLETAGGIYLFNAEQIKQYRSLVKDIRAVEPELMVKAVGSLFANLNPQLLDSKTVEAIVKSGQPIITPDDETFAPLLTKLFPNNPITKDPIFLRWDKKRSISRTDITPDEHISSGDFDKKIMAMATQTASKSSDWWRQVGAVLVSPDAKILLKARNRHLPHDYQHYSDGDPRAEFQSGEHIETTSSIHAESELIALASKDGIKTENCSLYVTTFPCPVCAKLVAQAGISQIYYRDGYALLDGESVLKSAGIKVTRVVD